MNTTQPNPNTCSLPAREIFWVAVKIIGFIVLLQGLNDVFQAILIIKDYAHITRSTPQFWVFMGVIKIVAGVYLMVGATPFMVLAFPPKTEPTENTEATSQPKLSGGASESAIPGKRISIEPKALFDVFIKAIGLVVFLYGLDFLFTAVTVVMRTSGPINDTSSIFHCIVEMGAGLVLMRGVLPLPDFAFPAKPVPPTESSDRPPV